MYRYGTSGKPAAGSVPARIVRASGESELPKSVPDIGLWIRGELIIMSVGVDAAVALVKETVLQVAERTGVEVDAVA